MPLQGYRTYSPPAFVVFFCPARLSLSFVFCLVIAVSIVLTLVSINENLHVRRTWRVSVPVPVAQSIPTVPPVNTALVDASVPNNNINYTFHHTADPKWQARISKLKKFKSKLLMMKFPYLGSTGSVGKGWTVLPDNVVVPSGDVDNPHEFAYVVNSEEACREFFASGRPKILIFVESDVRNGDRRQAIRQTWALPMLQKALNFKVVFMLGASRARETQEIVDEEFYAYGDVVQENFTENFRHLTLKSIMGLKWASTYCPQVDYVIKSDDDILIHVPNLVETLSAVQNPKRVLLCHKNRSRLIIRRGTNLIKYQVSPLELPGGFFPLYCGGFTYIMSWDVARDLYVASTKTPYFFIEDAYVTGFCRHRVGVELVDHPNIVLRPYVSAAQAPCSFAEGRITSQELVGDEMKLMWQALNTRGFFCPVPVNSTTPQVVT